MLDDDLRDDLRSEYDFSELKGAVRGKYAAKHRKRTNVVLLDDDVAQAFPNEETVNEALRLLLKLAKQQVNQPQH